MPAGSNCPPKTSLLVLWRPRQAFLFVPRECPDKGNRCGSRKEQTADGLAVKHDYPVPNCESGWEL
jgi:hypothetical protein